jgi:hypothetical protein
VTRPVLLAIALLLLAGGPLAAAPPAPPVGAWATYQWTSAIRQEVPVIVRQDVPGGQATWSVARESTAPAPLYVTYAIVRGDARTYTLQIVTRQRVDGPPLAVTHVRVDRASGKALRSVTQRPKGLVPTPESGLRPFRPGAVKGAEEPVAVPAGRFTTIRAPWRDGTVWVSDQAPALGLVKATFPSGTLELVESGAGARDLLRS